MFTFGEHFLNNETFIIMPESRRNGWDLGRELEWDIHPKAWLGWVENSGFRRN